MLDAPIYPGRTNLLAELLSDTFPSLATVYGSHKTRVNEEGPPLQRCGIVLAVALAAGFTPTADAGSAPGPRGRASARLDRQDSTLATLARLTLRSSRDGRRAQTTRGLLPRSLRRGRLNAEDLRKTQSSYGQRFYPYVLPQVQALLTKTWRTRLVAQKPRCWKRSTTARTEYGPAVYSK